MPELKKVELLRMNECSYINYWQVQYYLPFRLRYRLPFELAGSAKFLHFTILGGSQTPPAPIP